MKPTLEQFNALQAMFDYFNVTLFGGELPNIILNLSRKGSSVGGFFAPSRWKKVGDKEEKETVHEISLNPECLRKDIKEVTSILVHEMVHLWQEEFGKNKPSNGYHNKEWGDKMEEIGLMPSNTGVEGGKKTGKQMTHYIIEDGAFNEVYNQIDPDILLPFEHINTFKISKPNKNKTKYTCLCDNNIWGKEGLEVVCKDCNHKFVEQS